MEPPKSGGWSDDNGMRATKEAINAANKVAKDLAVRSAKAAGRKKAQTVRTEQHVSNFSTVANTQQRLF